MALVAVVLLCDAVLPHTAAVAAIAAIDEPAHLATAALVVIAAAPAMLRRPAVLVTILASAVLIDLDHIPLYLGWQAIAPGGRPVTHSLATPLVLLAVRAVLPLRLRPWPAAVALGVCLHLVRDLATGPGVSLCWPLTSQALLLPYPLYAAAVVALGLVAGVRLARDRAAPAERRLEAPAHRFPDLK